MHSNMRNERREGKKREGRREKRGGHMTSLIALAWEWVGEWGGCSSTNAQQAALAGLAGGRFGELREQVDAEPRVVFLGASF